MAPHVMKGRSEMLMAPDVIPDMCIYLSSVGIQIKIVYMLQIFQVGSKW